ncbi:adenylate cyclase [Actinobacillus succinogenes]|uniref:Adenylate cyclase n=1 Tax=Actinobacillus succinogenes (strain ATCC 55618 / DSM 22257 / CCUG 43843 / 130Z) TaxID=339671 RepID=A6VN98_ACTSZ|nr:inorganic triphosphatase [Actinobacillus succinogenes]ABR74445.1 adenylate cyclase [Actinobacillus succinogenes 130Z]PHI41135.1 adenylate cyclase [Actinobacillus succinogenes]
MSNEVELKLEVSRTFADSFAQNMTDFHILSTQTVILGNCYYDTPDQFFAQRKMGLRVRSENERFTMTLKTDGQVTGGLHIRPEYNFVLSSAEPDLTLLKDLSFDLPGHLPLEPIFSTDFTRQFWLIECGHETEIEVALDRGEIKTTEKTQPICEIEFELKQGSLSDLLTFVANLPVIDGVRLSSASKAKRGYRLAFNTLSVPMDCLTKWREFLQFEQTVQNPKEILTALLDYEQQLVEDTVFFSPAYFAQDFMRSVERIGSFFNLLNYYTENKKLLNAVAKMVEADEQILVELNESNEALFQNIHDIIRLHSETRDNALAMGKLDELLHQGQNVKRMINLIRLTVDEYGKSPQNGLRM